MLSEPQSETDALLGDCSVGVPVFSRTEALEDLLASVPDRVSTVIVADNGHTGDRDALYSQDWPFDVRVLDLDYDVGIGACRAAIAEAVETEYLFVGDCDMRFVRPTDLGTLLRLLQTEPHLGGVSAWLWEGNRIRSGASNFHRIDDWGQTTLVKAVSERPTIQRSADGLPYAVFDNIPQAGVFRTTIFEEGHWDDTLQNTEHADFFLGQQATDWEFASTPAVVIHHQMEIDPAYRADKRQQDTTDLNMLDRKHGVAWLSSGTRPDWVTTRARSPPERAFDLFRQVTPPQVWLPVRRLACRLGVFG